MSDTIGQVTYSYLPLVGGADAYADELHRAIESWGLQSVVFQRPVAGVTAGHVRLVQNQFATLPFSFWTQPFFLQRYAAELRSCAALICHYPNYLLPLTQMRRDGRPALVGLSHGVFWDDRPGSVRSFLKREWARQAFRVADAYVANDTFFLREMGLDIEPATRLFEQVAPGRWFIPCCVDTDYWQAGPPDPQLAPRHAIIAPRNLYFNRGVHLAVQAFAQIADRHREAHLVIVGASSQGKYAQWVQQLVFDLGLTSRVIFWGPVPHDRMRAVYSSARVVVIPSLCGEGTSLSALEAMACGAATVTTDVAGLKDLPAEKAAPTPADLAAALDKAYLAGPELGLAQQARVRESYCLPRWREGWRRALEHCGVNLP